MLFFTLNVNKTFYSFEGMRERMLTVSLLHYKIVLIFVSSAVVLLNIYQC